MQELPSASLQDQSLSSGSGFRARDVSPDSVIFTADSNFSLFSSTSASVDRCSFASDIHDQEDSVVSDISQVRIFFPLIRLWVYAFFFSVEFLSEIEE